MSQSNKPSFLSRLFAKAETTAEPKPSAPAAAIEHKLQQVTLDPAHEEAVLRIGSSLLTEAAKHRGGVLSAGFWRDKLMDFAMKDKQFKIQLFRFVDTFPVLRTPEAVHDHLIDYLTQPGVKLPAGMGMAMKAGGAAKGLMASQTASQIEGMAKNFIAGEDAATALPMLSKLWKSNIAFSVDLLGEACVSDAEADMYRNKYLDLVGNLPTTANNWNPSDQLEQDHLGQVPRCNVSIKLSSLSAKMDAIDPDGAFNDIYPRLKPILELARDKGVLINFDMEAYDHKDLTLDIFERCCEAIDFEAGLAMQAYLRSGEDDAKRIIEWSKRTGRVVTVRLVKGAYWDFETIHAEMMGWPCPVWGHKWETDACFERMSKLFIDSTPKEKGQGGVKLALGSHNARSISSALARIEERGLPEKALELQMLHGMADELKKAAVSRGMRVREYVPVGEMIPGMAYLVRRLLENTSNESWLLASQGGSVSNEILLGAPKPKHTDAPALADELSPTDVEALQAQLADRHELSPAVEGVGTGSHANKPFFTDPMRDFADKSTRDNFAKAIVKAKTQFDKVGISAEENYVNEDDTRDAISNAQQFFQSFWRDTDPLKRAEVLVRTAQLMRKRRDELSGIIIKENGKDWRNADADVTEAIDFLEYYARTAPGLFERQRLGKFIGELNEHFYQPRGVAVVIAPWNFPLAIACGMTAAALVTGNTVILKPAEQTPKIALEMCQMMSHALQEVFGFEQSRYALQFLLGQGETVGAALVRDPRVSLIAFTGSKAVGLNIIEAAGTTPEHQLHVKKVVCEMGGKNTVIVDTSADLDEAVLGVRQSAFGFAGQKCSACSRVVIVDPQGPQGPHITAFTQRLVESTKALVCGDPMRPGTDVGPVIDDEAADKIMGFIKRANEAGLTQATGGDAIRLDDSSPVQPKNVVVPHIFTGVTPDHELASEEVFGPVLAVMHASTYNEAMNIANSTAYKLTGGVFSRMPTHLERAKREFRVGNLYLNRNITGALVGRQPFGGFGMSGVGSKAGGHDYLLQFVEPRAISENTMRRGFAPEL